MQPLASDMYAVQCWDRSNSWSDRARRGGAVLVFAIFLSYGALGQESGGAVAPHALVPRPDAAPFTEVVRLVRDKGWLANLGQICAQLGLLPAGDACQFRQISVQETEGRGDPHAVNVPLVAEGEPFALVFHLGPLVGEFFVVSPEGRLIAAFIRTKGSGYTRLPDSEAAPALRSDLAYWRNNLERIERGLASPPPSSR